MPSGDNVHLQALEPQLACPGAAVTIRGRGLLGDSAQPPIVTLGERAARLASASNARVSFRVPDEVGGFAPVRVSSAPGESLILQVARGLADGIHQVDSPVFDARGRLYVTVSGSRGQQSPVSVFRVEPNGAREPFASGIVNPTSLAFGPDGFLYVTSRFEGVVYRLSERGEPSQVATEMGVACGLAFAADGAMYVGDRSGTLFRVRAGQQASVVATLPPSVAAYHLAVGPDGWIYVSIPTLATCDSVYRVSPDGRIEVVHTGFGRPQGVAFDPRGVLHVVEALAGSSGIFRVEAGRPPALVAAGDGLVGVTFDPHGALVVASNETVYGFTAFGGPVVSVS
jgi:sugar lactone lactonase YvrE